MNKLLSARGGTHGPSVRHPLFRVIPLPMAPHGSVLIRALFMAIFFSLLTNPGFEGSTAKATGWNDISWGSGLPSWSYSRETTNIHGGLSAQRIAVTSLGSSDAGYIFKQDFIFKMGIASSNNI